VLVNNRFLDLPQRIVDDEGLPSKRVSPLGETRPIPGAFVVEASTIPKGALLEVLPLQQNEGGTRQERLQPYNSRSIGVPF